MMVIIFCLLFLFALPITSSSTTPELKFGFKYLNFNFRTKEEKETYMNKREYENCMLAGVKVNSKGTYFVSVPRWKPDVPSTLNKLLIGSEVLLDPFPTWEMNKIGNSTAFQSVLGFEIDRNDKLWVLDQGKVNNVGAIPNSIKLVKLDSVTGKWKEFTESQNRWGH